MSMLYDFTDEELLQELHDRKVMKEAKNSVPFMLDEQDIKEALYESLHDQVVGVLNSVSENGYHREDDAHYMFEAVMLSFYGEDFFTWYNKVHTG